MERSHCRTRSPSSADSRATPATKTRIPRSHRPASPIPIDTVAPPRAFVRPGGRGSGGRRGCSCSRKIRHMCEAGRRLRAWSSDGEAGKRSLLLLLEVLLVRVQLEGVGGSCRLLLMLLALQLGAGQR